MGFVLNFKLLTVLAICTLLGACESPLTQRYSISVDNNRAIKSLQITPVAVSPFEEPETFDAGCRASGALKVSDNLTHTQYIYKALKDELEFADSLASADANTTLTGAVKKLEFTSSRGITGGAWTIDLHLASSNGKSLDVSEYYEFEAGFSAMTACTNTAGAFVRVVQNLIGKIFRHPDFPSLAESIR